MAENIVAGLFGLTPEMYGEQQRRSALNEGIALAQLDPASRGAAMTYAGARGLGGAIAGALGVEDPQLKMISVRQQIMSQLDQSDPESIIKGAQMLAQAGDQQGAMAFADYYRKAQGDIAQTKQRLAAALASEATAKRERTPTTSKEAQYAKDVALLSGPEGSIEYNTEYAKALLEAKDKPEKLISSGTDRDALSREMYDNKIYVDLTSAQKAAVNKRLEQEQGTRAEKGAPKVYAPGQQVGVKDWQSFTLDVLSKDPVMQRTTNILSDAPAALEVIRTSTSNDISAAALPGTLSRLVGKDSSISNLDIKTYASTGGLDDVLASSAVKFFTGRATDVKKDQAEKFTIALYRGALLARKKKLETAAEEFGYSTSPNYKFAIKNIDDQLAQFKLVKKGEGAPTTTKTGNPLVDKWLSTDAEK
jgi:hypothetical protein